MAHRQAWSWPANRPGRPEPPGGRRPRGVIVRLAAYIALVVTWRLPGVVEVLVRESALTAADMATLVIAGSGVCLSLAADQQIAVAILWAGPAVCFIPVIYALLIPWLSKRDDPGGELREANATRSGLGGLPRPPRGWRA